jgi:hypothetical protein
MTGNSGVAAFARLIRHPVKFRLFLLSKLPSAYFTGVRVKEIDGNRCVTTVPYKWFSKNPFRSTYFASLAMAAEMSTGTLALAHIYQRTPSISMLLVKLEADYFKKATDLTSFTCEDGDMIRQAIDECVTQGEPRTIRVRSVGKNKAGEVVAEFAVTWSFKARKQ